MRVLLLLAAHGLVSTGVAFGAMTIGAGTIESRTSDSALVAYIALQLLAALVIAAAARPGRKVLIGVLATAAAAWAFWCGMVAGMALSGSWL